MSFGAQFLAGQKFAQGLIDTYRDAQQRRELDEISKAQPVSADFLSDDASAKVQAAAADPTQHIGYDVGAKAYMATPKLGEDEMGPAQPKQIATAVPMTELLGKRTPGTMTPDQVSSAKFKAMADVISKSDPIQGMRLQREVKQGERDDKRWEREDATATKAENDKAFAEKLDGQVGEWFKGRLKNPDGTERAPTVDDHLAASQYRAAQLTAAGKIDQAGQVLKDYAAQSLVKIQLQGAQRKEALGRTAAALASGDLDAVKEFYNEFVPDGARVTDVKRGAGGELVIQRESLDGRALPAYTMKDTGQLLSVLNSFNDPMALYNWSQNEFKNNLALNADKRAETQLNETIRHNRASEGIAGANLRIAQDEAARKKQVFEQQNKIPEPVRKSYEALETQAKALDSAMYKAMAEGAWQPGTPGTEKLIADRTAVSLRMNKLLDPYMPTAKQGASAPAADPLGLRTPPAAEKATPPAATPAAASPAIRDTPMQSELAPRAATAPAQTVRQPLTTLADVMGANSGDASLNSVLAPRVAAVQQAADAVKASQAAVANAGKSQNAQAVSAAIAQSYEAQKALDALLSGWNPQQAAAIRKAVGL